MQAGKESKPDFPEAGLARRPSRQSSLPFSWGPFLAAGGILKATRTFYCQEEN